MLLIFVTNVGMGGSSTGAGGSEGALIQLWRNFGHYAMLVLALSLGLATPVYGDDVVIRFSFTEPTKNADNTDLIDLKEFKAVFKKTDTSQWISDVTIPARTPNGGKRNEFTATLTYPNGGAETGTMELSALDMYDNASAVATVNITAQLAPIVGEPGVPMAIGACTVP